MDPYFGNQMSQKYKIGQFNSVLGSKRSLSCNQQQYFDQPTPIVDRREFTGSFYNLLYAPVGSEPNKDILESNSFDNANE